MRVTDPRPTGLAGAAAKAVRTTRKRQATVATKEVSRYSNLITLISETNAHSANRARRLQPTRERSIFFKASTAAALKYAQACFCQAINRWDKQIRRKCARS